MFSEEVLLIIYYIMKTNEIGEFYLPKECIVESDSPAMTITYDTDTKQYIFRLKENREWQ